MWFENLYPLANLFLEISSSFFLQHKYLYSIKSFLTFVYSRQYSQSFCLIPYALHFLLLYLFLHLILWIPSAMLSRRFHNELAINLGYQYIIICKIWFLYFYLFIFFYIFINPFKLFLLLELDFFSFFSIFF